MKKNFLKTALALMLGGCIMFTSCIGSFGLSGKVLSWNQNVSNKFVNELIFLGFCILPVYEISMLADVLVLNSIEFWSGSNPVADNASPVKVKGGNGEYTVQRTESGYHIENTTMSAATDLLFNEAEQSWNVVTVEGQTIPLLKFNEGNEVVMYLPNGDQMPVDLSKEGVTAFRNAAISNLALR